MTVIKYDGAQAGDCIQIGSGTERCNHLYSWPAEWTSGAVIGQTYTALVDVSDAQYSWAPGVYTVRWLLSFFIYFLLPCSLVISQMCFGDSDLDSNAVDTYKGSVSFPALVSEPENSIVVSSSFGAPLEV